MGSLPAHAYAEAQRYTHAHNELPPTGGGGGWGVGGGKRGAARGSGASVVKERYEAFMQEAPARISAQKEEEVGAAEGSNDGFALRKKK